MITRRELVSMFVAVAAMAIVLVFVRAGGVPEFAVFERASGERQGAVVAVAGDTENREAARAEAITEAATPSGDLKQLIVEDVIIGTGTRPVAKGDTVTVHYEGRTQDGIMFDSSYADGEPFTFTVGKNHVIEGWEQGILGMRTGGERILVIPPGLAYGNAQVGPIPAGSTLVFSIELLSVE